MLTFFNKTVIIAAIIVLIISMLIYTINFKSNLKISKINFPPVVPKCPDYWNVKTINYNNRDLNYCKSNNINTGSWKNNIYYPYDDKCYNYQWARYNNITWDGISNLIKDEHDEQYDQDCQFIYDDYLINNYSKSKSDHLNNYLNEN